MYYNIVIYLYYYYIYYASNIILTLELSTIKASETLI